MQQPVDLPDFVPAELQRAYGDEARRRVSHHAHRRAAGDPNASLMPSKAVTDRHRPPGGGAANPDRGTDLAAAALIAVPGAVILSALWVWLALTTSDGIWWFTAAGGVAIAATLIVAVGRSVTHRHRAAAQPNAATHRTVPQPTAEPR